MTWQQIANLNLTNAWQITAPVEGNLFRLKHTLSGISDPIPYLKGAIAQAELIQGEPLTLYEAQRFHYQGSESEALRLEQPEGFQERRIAIRRLDAVPGNWNVQIEGSDINMDNATADEIRAELAVGLATKSPINHTHAIAGVDGLAAALDTKAPTQHTHAIAAVEGLQVALASKTPSIYFASQLQPVSASGTTATNLFEVLIPGGKLRAGDFLRINYLFSANNNANGKAIISKLNNGVIQTSYAINGNTQLAGSRLLAVRNSSEVVWIAGLTIGVGTTTSVTPVRLPTDLTQDQTFTIAGQLSNPSDNLTLEYVLIELLQP